MKNFFECALMLVVAVFIILLDKEAQKEIAQFNYGEDWAEHI